MRFEVLDIPGHSPGHVVFVLRGEPIRVFGGDVLFRGSIGRTDFPGGSLEQLLTGIHRKLFTLSRDLLSVATNPIPLKTAMKLLGRDTGELRLPLCALDAAG